jgi:hypothetical protein
MAGKTYQNRRFHDMEVFPQRDTSTSGLCVIRRTNGHSSSNDREILSHACEAPGADAPVRARIDGFFV